MCDIGIYRQPSQITPFTIKTFFFKRHFIDFRIYSAKSNYDSSYHNQNQTGCFEVIRRLLVEYFY